ncbi:MAG: inositol monophosphatase family protein [bacterium]|nr:inositol monophosphatase family protein [bacterium]
MTDDPQKFLDVALAAVKKAEPVFKKHFGNPSSVVEKQHRDWVTDIDREIEKMLIGDIKRNFPEHEIVGEEFSPALIPKGKYVWYLDPIDGTSQYIHGIPFCCISAALVDDQGPLVGVISNPETGELFHAVRGGGAFKNGKKISVSSAKELLKSYGGVGWADNLALQGFLGSLIPLIGKIRVYASSALQLCFVADGRFDSYVVTGIHPWDIAAGVLIAKEAGASITDFENRPYNISSPDLLATNGHIHQDFLSAIKKARG